MESIERKIVIKDSCILFDLTDLNLLEDFFQLDLIVLTTHYVIGEVTSDTQMIEVSKFIHNGKLIINSDGEFQAIYSISEKYSALSLADSSVLELAMRRKAIILSSDKILRKICVKENLIVRGIVWVIEELYKNKSLSSEMVLDKLKNYKTINQRAPVEEIEKLIKRISK